MTEYLDIYDNNGEKTGERLPKDEVHKKGLWHLSVNLWVVTPAHKILLAKRSKTIDSYPNCWAHSAAGHVSTGETSEAAVIKEAKEEIGLKIEPGEIEHLFRYEKEDTFFPHKIPHLSHFDVYLTVRDVDLSKIKMDPKEVSEVKLVTLDELKEMAETPNLMLPFPYEYPKIIDILKKKFKKS